MHLTSQPADRSRLRSSVSGMSLATLTDIFFAIVDRGRERVMMHRQAIQWVSISSQELYRNVVGVARALIAWGIGKGDRVAILSENRREWSTADFATLLLGAVVVPVYATLTDQQTTYILRDSATKAIFVSNEKQLLKILAIQNQTPLEKIVVMDAVETAHAFHMHRIMQTAATGPDGAIEAVAHSIRPDDLATIIYTSGTTGTPKGAMLTHGNMASNISCSLLD